ncbi:MAG: LytTR family DNA-binding domain-containing protein [Saprospiraceae bacterium]
MDSHRIIHAAWIDDESFNLEFGKRQMATHFQEINCRFFQHPESALHHMNQHPVDLLFLDIQMPDLNGFQLLERLISPLPVVIFVTAYDEYAIKAIRFSALDYLLKPVDINLWKAATLRAVRRIQNDRQSEQLQSMIDQLRHKKLEKLALPSLDRIDFVSVERIIRCEGQNNYTHIYTMDGHYLVSRTLKDYEEMLSDSGFVRVHLSHLIQISQVKTLRKKDGIQLILYDGTSIPVARSRRDEVLAALGL